MNQHTQVKEIKVRSRTEKWMKTTAELTEWEEEPRGFGAAFLRLDRLVRNFAVVAGLVLVTVAVRSSNVPEVQSVFGAIQESAGIKWDESIGKLSFVSSFLPEEIQAVWSEARANPVCSPADGSVVHAWSVNEPYLLIDGGFAAVYAAADGEVMSIAHGLGEEQIVRLRHLDGSESVYGNLESCALEIGQLVQVGETVGNRMKNMPLAFEVRMDGRSVEPVFGIE